MIYAKTAAMSLKTADEIISDSLLRPMILGGLPVAYKTFATIIYMDGLKNKCG